MLPSEARRADSGGWVLEEEGASPLPTSKRGLGTAANFSDLSVLWGLQAAYVIRPKGKQLQKSLSLLARGVAPTPPALWGGRNYMSRGVVNCSTGVGGSTPYPQSTCTVGLLYIIRRPTKSSFPTQEMLLCCTGVLNKCIPMTLFTAYSMTEHQPS